MKKVTPQEVLNAYNTVVASEPDPQRLFQVLPDKLEDLTNEQQALFQRMALGMNCIVGEMEVEDKSC